jgi:hypothetical protein
LSQIQSKGRTEEEKMSKEASEEPRKERTHGLRNGAIVIIAIVAMISAVFYAVGTTVSNNKADAKAKTVSPWKMDLHPNLAHGRWFGDGSNPINTARTPKQARAALNDWLMGVRVSPARLAAAYQMLLGKHVSKASLVHKGWATKKAVKVYTKIRDFLATCKVVPDTAPASGWNSGIHAGSLVIAPSGGISGDRRAIRVTAKDGSGRMWWILGRCGNIVTPSKSAAPPKTHRHRAHNAAKNWRNDPSHKGNAKTGGGKHKKGPGHKQKPSDVTHPRLRTRHGGKSIQLQHLQGINSCLDALRPQSSLLLVIRPLYSGIDMHVVII